MGSNEINAEIAGWNALQSRLKHLDPDSKSLHEDMIRRAEPAASCSNGTPPALEPGIRLEADGRMHFNPKDPKSVLPIYACHFDGVGFVPGKQNNVTSVYRNHYGVEAINSIVTAQRRWHGVDRDTGHDVLLDMKRLGLNHEKLEANGLDFGKSGAPFTYIDISDGKQSMRSFTPLQHAPTITVTPKTMTEPAALRISTADAPLFDALRQRLPPQTSPDRLAQIALAARLGGVTAGNLHAVDVDGQRLHVVSTVPGLRGSIDLASAPPPQAESLQQLQQLDRLQARELEQFREEQAQINAAQGQAVQPER